MNKELIDFLFLTKIIDKKKDVKINGIVIERYLLLDDKIYKKVKKDLYKFKKYFSSSILTCLQSNAEDKQKWPLINITRQILKAYNYKLQPFKKSNGTNKDGTKKFKRYFKIIKI